MWQPIFNRIILLLKFPLWLCFSLGAHRLYLLKCSTMTWAAQMHALVSLPENCGTNPRWADWSWSTDTEAPELLLVSLIIDTDLFLFVIYFLLLGVPNIHNEQRGASYFKPGKFYARTPSFASLNIDFGWSWYNFS